MEEHRLYAAVHEAAHAVMAYYFGWWVNNEGVDLDERWYCGLSCYKDAHTAEAEICISLAGWLAETLRNPGLPRSCDDHDLEFALSDVRGDWETEGTDDEAVFRRLVQEYPDLDDEGLMRSIECMRRKR